MTVSARAPLAPPSAEAIARRNGLVEALHQTTLGLLHRTDTAGLLEDTAKRAAGLAGAPEAYIYVVDAAAQDLVVTAAVGTHVQK
jgi:hypothetical protein